MRPISRGFLAFACLLATPMVWAAQEVEPYQARPITELGVDVGIPSGITPPNRAVEEGRFDRHASSCSQRSWPLMTRTWKASATRHRPLYFEEVNAERYGYTTTRSSVLQPIVSAAHFFGTVPYLPYLMAADPPCECVYTLGHYRPGSCPPYHKHGWPVSAKGAVAEAVVVVGLIALIP